MSSLYELIPDTPTPEQLSALDEQMGIIHLLTGQTAKGEDFYAYVSIPPSRYEDFVLITRAGEDMNVEEFGEVLEKGFGLTPPADVMQRMEDHFGVVHGFTEKMETGAMS